jgi:hypothetical protein
MLPHFRLGNIKGPASRWAVCCLSGASLYFISTAQNCGKNWREIANVSHIGKAGTDEVVTKLVEPSIPQRLLTRSLFVDTDLSYTH